MNAAAGTIDLANKCNLPNYQSSASTIANLVVPAQTGVLTVLAHQDLAQLV